MGLNSQLIKKGEKIFLCAHDQDSGYHFFEVLEGEQVVNSKGQVMEGRWILLCNDCFALADKTDDPTPYIARISVWEEDALVYCQEKDSGLEFKIQAVLN